MGKSYVVGIDQSTQGTKAILVNSGGEIVGKSYLPHRQIVSEEGWVSHDGEEIYRNTVQAVKELLDRAEISPQRVAAFGISNQRETTIAWDRETGAPVGHAVVWQCSRAKEITDEIADAGFRQMVREKTGIPFSPFFPAAKAAWILRHNVKAKELARQNRLCIGTVDSWLVYKLTGGKVFQTDHSNASRTQLFDLHTLKWDTEICGRLGIPVSALPEVVDSNGDFGSTTLEGYFGEPVPIRGVLGDSHAALFGQGCVKPGMAKATFGTGSSIMMNIGPVFKASESGLVTSLAWGIDGRVDYVMEGNINYAGAVITWLQKDLHLISSAAETEALAKEANPADATYLVPAFSGIGAPYWSSDAKALITGMSRTTGRAELVKAGLESIAYQVADIVEATGKDSGVVPAELRVDGGPTSNQYLMQFESDITGAAIRVPEAEELSAIGAAVMAGIAAGVMDSGVLQKDRTKRTYLPQMNDEAREMKKKGWKAAVKKAIF